MFLRADNTQTLAFPSNSVTRHPGGLLPSFAKASEGLCKSSEAAQQRRRIAGRDTRIFGSHLMGYSWSM
jgi:hypothetical protein